MYNIPQATGCSIEVKDLLKEEKKYNIMDFGAKPNGNPVDNTNAINKAIEMAAQNGGTVIFPSGDFKCYTIRLKSNVNLYLENGAVIHAARTDIKKAREKQIGEGGNYDEPEINLYAGLQDHGHTYFKNSLIYGADIENVMIYGDGLIDGSYIDEETGYRNYVLQGGDPFDNTMRNQKGHNGEWFGNKGISLVRCKNVILKDFDVLIGGHFAIITEGVTNMLVEDIIVDTTRDAFDIDCCENVTVRNCTFNSLTDDALVMKSSYGAGIFMPTKNVLIEDCTVSGYDAGSVLAKTYTRDKLIATDRCGPTARVKFGTEASCGYELVTIRRVKFDRSRGFAMEAVDGSDLNDIIFTDCIMDDVSSSPIFIKIGDRARFPVTGNSSKELVTAEETNVRLDNRNWILPNTQDYQKYPIRRYTPSYNKTKEVTVDGHSSFKIVDAKEPAKINTANFTFESGKYYLKKYDEKTNRYVTDYSKEIAEKDLFLYANGSGSDHIAKIYNIEISNVKITNADPRYPIIFMGLVDSPIKNVYLKNIEVEYRGGLKMEHAVEQRQLNTNWEYSQYETKSSVQTLPWLVNTFFLKDEGLLPRVDWDSQNNCWTDDPYNVPELPNVYPEPSNWGILPAYGMYARHIDGLTMENIKFSFKVEDERHSVVLDNAHNVKIENFDTDIKDGVEEFAFVTNNFKRHTNMEYISGEPYFKTEVRDVEIPEKFKVKEITVNAPAPGTPSDNFYNYPTAAHSETGYKFKVPTENYPIPFTVFRPFFVPVSDKKVKTGEEIKFKLVVRNPASEKTNMETDNFIYNEKAKKRDFVVNTVERELKLECKNKPQGAVFDAETGIFEWKPEENQKGNHIIKFIVDDGIIPEEMTVNIEVI